MVLFLCLCFVRSLSLQVRAIQSLARCVYLNSFLMNQSRSPFLHGSILIGPSPLVHPHPPSLASYDAKKVCYLSLEFLSLPSFPPLSSLLPLPYHQGAKKVCYLSLEFLVGRSLQLAVACLHSQVSQGHAVRATQ